MSFDINKLIKYEPSGNFYPYINDYDETFEEYFKQLFQSFDAQQEIKQNVIPVTYFNYNDYLTYVSYSIRKNKTSDYTVNSCPSRRLKTYYALNCAVCKYAPVYFFWEGELKRSLNENDSEASIGLDIPSLNVNAFDFPEEFILLKTYLESKGFKTFSKEEFSIKIEATNETLFHHLFHLND